jgi:hypothetical protein
MRLLLRRQIGELRAARGRWAALLLALTLSVALCWATALIAGSANRQFPFSMKARRKGLTPVIAGTVNNLHMQRHVFRFTRI